MLLKITSLLKQEEESKLSVSRRNLVEKSVAVKLQLTVPATGQRTSHVRSRQPPPQATAGPPQVGLGAHVETSPIPPAILGKKNMNWDSSEIMFCFFLEENIPPVPHPYTLLLGQ